MVLSPRSLCLQNWLKLHHLGPQFSEMAWCPADFPEDALEAPSPGWSLWQLHPGGGAQNGHVRRIFFKGSCLLKFRFGVLSALRSMAWCDHCSGMMMRNSTGTDDHVVMRCVSLIGDMSHVPTGCNLVVCYHSISWLDNTLQPHAELTCIYIYIYIYILWDVLWNIFIRIVSLRASARAVHSKAVEHERHRGLVKRFNLYEMWTTSVKRW